MDDNFVKLFKEFEGIIGALLGVGAGTLSSHFQNNSGKVKAFFTDARCFFQIAELDSWGSLKSETEENREKATTFVFNSNIELYNSSNTKKVLRDINLLIKMKKNKKYIKLQHNDRTESYFDLLNIEAKTIVEYPIYAIAKKSEDTKALFENEIKSLYIEYKDTKGRRHKFKIKPLTLK